MYEDTDPIANIDCILLERRWMVRTKSIRVFLRLNVEDPTTLAAILTNMIEWRVRADIRPITENVSPVFLDPCFICNVEMKGKNWVVSIETLMETQKALAPGLTLLVDQAVSLTIREVSQGDEDEPEEPEQPPENDDWISASQIKSLHVAIFPNPDFSRWLTYRMEEPVRGQDEAKEAFKRYLDVETTKNITQRQLSKVMADFSKWTKENPA